MPWIRFFTSYTVRATNGAKYASGQEVELSEASAAHFVNAGVAVSIPPPLAGVPRAAKVTIPVPNKAPPSVTVPLPPSAPVETPTVTTTEETSGEQLDPPPASSAPQPTATQPRPSARARAQAPPVGT